mmetsp:Transcript_11108/g.15320  ORF Transcript_11108/g.15320 Transcript_11108/m.15320 type:complete len:87 (+) Transcript_11108:403-663(+)
MKAKLTFPIFQALKMVVSFLFFSLELWLDTTTVAGNRHKLRWLKNYPCHSAIAIDDDIYHDTSTTFNPYPSKLHRCGLATFSLYFC